MTARHRIPVVRGSFPRRGLTGLFLISGLALWLVLAAGTARAQVATPAAPPEKLIGMYIHQHWPYNHPYAARTWTFEDWHGYLDGLHRLGFNMVQIWPMLETMPDPLTPSDKTHLDKIARVIDAAHRDFGMKVWIVLCPNVAAIDETAARTTYEKRHFFYTDTRINPADAAAMDKLLAWREKLLKPLAQADAVVIIDSDPGGYPGSTNKEFVDLLGRHRKLLDQLRPGGIELIYWMWAGWPAYARFYETGEFAWGKKEEFDEAVSLLKELNPEPWGMARGLENAKRFGLESKVINLSYGVIENEPSFPMTHYGGNAAFESGAKMGPRGVMGNAQTHCVQLPNTFAFSRGATGRSLTDDDYTKFADDLIPGRGALIHASWKALAGSDARLMREKTAELKPLITAKLPEGPLKGLLFGDPNRFIKDLYLMLRARAAFVDFQEDARNDRDVTKSLARFAIWVERWQLTHGYECAWTWPGLDEALKKVKSPVLKDAEFPVEGNTAYDRLKSKYYGVESAVPRLIQAMRKALFEMDPDWEKVAEE